MPQDTREDRIRAALAHAKDAHAELKAVVEMPGWSGVKGSTRAADLLVALLEEVLFYDYEPAQTTNPLAPHRESAR